MSYDASRIINAIADKSVKRTGYQGIRLGTIVSVVPMKLKIDNINFEINAGSIVINSQLIEQDTIASVNSASATFAGATGVLSSPKTTIKNTEPLKIGDRVAVSQIDIKVWAILCKVVNA